MNNELTALRLSESEKNSQVWLKIKEHLENLNEKDRERNEDMGLTEGETLKLRAKISARKDVLKLDF